MRTASVRAKSFMQPYLLLGHQRDLDVIARIQVSLRRLLNGVASQRRDPIGEREHWREIGGLSVLIPQRELIEEIAIVLAVLLEFTLERVADDGHLPLREALGP